MREGVLEGKNAKWFDNLPRVGWAWGVFDEVRKDGEQVGLSHSRSYEADVHTFVSLAVVDLEHSDVGTDVRVVWGEPGGESPNPQVETHTQTEIRATVGEVPYTDERVASAEEVDESYEGY
jgi:vanillate/3-O-methylgallate O-demethylase